MQPPVCASHLATQHQRQILRPRRLSELRITGVDPAGRDIDQHLVVGQRRQLAYCITLAGAWRLRPDIPCDRLVCGALLAFARACCRSKEAGRDATGKGAGSWPVGAGS
jgi:hypothetical protein